MRILTINCGSSTLKFDVVDASSQGEVYRAASGVVDRIASDSVASLSVAGNALEVHEPAPDHTAAFTVASRLLEKVELLSGIEAVGHRVVHGGNRFREPEPIKEEVAAAIEDASAMAPLHNRPAVAVIRAARVRFGEATPMIATFDTAFYASLPDVAARYALPRGVSERLGIRRFGFHGLAHRYMTERYRELRPEVPDPRLITLQLGNGCSVTASRDGIAVDTSMGFTPLEGLIMGTRSGDLDPSIPLFLVEQEGMSAAEVEVLLNKRSGLLGISGNSNDMRELLDDARGGDDDSALAVRAFCYRAKKYVGAYLAVLGGTDAVLFGGGIGEHAPEIRQAICDGLGWAGVELDPERNRAPLGPDGSISREGAASEVWVIHVDEAVVIARDVLACINARVS